jgi:hypothetical protein
LTFAIDVARSTSLAQGQSVALFIGCSGPLRCDLNAQVSLCQHFDRMRSLRDPIEPIDLANMRQNGVRALAVRCPQCRSEKIMNVDDLKSRPAALAKLATDEAKSPARGRARYSAGVAQRIIKYN